MATPAEKKALLFLGAVALLGSGVRLWRSRASAHTSLHFNDSSSTYTSADGPTRSSSRSSAAHSGTYYRKKSSSPRHQNTRSDDDDFPANAIDLDVAPEADLAALGIIPEGVAHLIIADRDSFGPFGSLTALARVPYLSRATITKLAPYVTFSRLPRPPNAVMQERGRTDPTTGAQAATTTATPSPSKRTSKARSTVATPTRSSRRSRRPAQPTVLP